MVFIKKKFLTVFLVGLLFSFTGCSEIVSQLNLEDIISVSGSDAATHMKLVDVYGNFKEYRDSETGVHYILYMEQFENQSGMIGMCPRYDTDGTLYTD